LLQILSHFVALLKCDQGIDQTNGQFAKKAQTQLQLSY